MAYHPILPRFIGYRGSKREGGYGDWALGRIVEKLCAACTKRGDSCLRVVVNDFGDIDLGACVWCKARSVACSTVQRGGRTSKAKVKTAEDPKDKRNVSEMDSEESEEELLAKKFKSNSVIEESEEEWEEWDGIQDQEEWPKESGEVQEVDEVREEVEEVWEEVEEVRSRSPSSPEVREKTEEEKEMDKREVKRARKEARRSERKARRSERSEEMKDLIHAVVDLGKKVDRFVDEVRVSNALRNRADREDLEERRRWYFSDRVLNAKDWEKGSGEDSGRYSV
jgi:hypothetical protein